MQQHTQTFHTGALHLLFVFKYSSGYCQSLALGCVFIFGTGYRIEVDRIAKEREREREAEQVNNTATSFSVCVNPGNLAGIGAIHCSQNTRH